MTVDTLPAPIPITTRDKEIEKWKRSFRVRVPAADTGTGTQPDTDARTNADIVMPLYAAATINNNNTVLELARGAALDQWAEREGVDPRREAVGASGSVTFAGNLTGSTIPDTAEIKNSDTGVRYRVITTALYVPGDPIGIVGKDTGPGTNLAAGAQLKWTSPQPGSSDFAVVTTQANGTGLTGGRDKENDDEFLLRIQQEKQNRAASGNDAEYQLEAEKTPNVAIQKSFTYPAITMAGTIGLVFTMLPQHSGGSRIPNATQVSLVESHVTGEFPGDDGAMFGLLADQNTDVVYEIDWADSAAGWTDLAPWPVYYAVAPVSGPGAVQITSTSATVFTLATANSVYTGIQQPLAGQTIAFYDKAGFTWRRKRILSFTGTGPWVITCDTTNNASDVSYTPAVGQRACPWSDSLPSILTGLWAYFDTLGPGEQVSTFYDEGTRQRRQPDSKLSWNYSTTTRGLSDAAELAAEVADVGVIEGDEVTPAVGNPGTLSYLLLLRYLAVFPKT